MGKKVNRLLCSEGFVFFLEDIENKNISSEEFNSSSFDVLNNNFYKKKTVIQNVNSFNYENTTETEFFFN